MSLRALSIAAVLSLGCPMALAQPTVGEVEASYFLAEANTNVRGVIAIGLPVRKYGFPEIDRLHQPFSVVQGSEDEFGLPSEVQSVLDRAQSPGELRVVRGAPHLFPGRAREARGTTRDASQPGYRVAVAAIAGGVQARRLFVD